MCPNFYSNLKPAFKPRNISCGSIPCYTYKGDLKKTLQDKKLARQQAIELLEDMLTIREFEEMIVKLRANAYEPIRDFNYRGPTHVSIGQEAASVGACAGLAPLDYITSTHRGHGDSIAKGMIALRSLSTDRLRQRVPEASSGTRKKNLDAALEDHLFRTIAELFGKEEGYCRGRGGGMHIADFALGHLGANAIVGGGVPIAVGAAMSCRYLRNGHVALSFAGDGAYANGIVLESLNWAAQKQFTNHLAKDKAFGLPIVFVILNNHYGMTGRAEEEVFGVSPLARRAAGFADNNMHAETVNGMDVLAVRDAVERAAETCRNGRGPCLVEIDTYRYYGHSLSDPRNEYRLREEEEAWKKVDPISSYTRQLLDAGVLTSRTLKTLQQRVVERNALAAQRAAAAADPDPADVIRFMYTDTCADNVAEEHAKVEIINPPPAIKRSNGALTYRDAIKEALLEEMQRDNRVIFYGEDVADYGGAFKATKHLMETFGRQRVFNTPISEAAICSTAVGAAMSGLRPVVELMYMDFTLMAADAISNQAAKWHYMSGANVKIPMVIRASVGGGKGYGGQHSQTLESVFAHIPGLYVVYPSSADDAKGMLKAAIRDDNPVLFVESQLLYGEKAEVPEEEYLIAPGSAAVKKTGKDLTLVAWGPAVGDALKASELIRERLGLEAEVIDIRSLVPLDMDTILASVRKTGRCIVASQAVNIGSFTGEIAANIMAQAFDDLDAPVLRVGAKNGIAPQSHVLEAAFLPTAEDIADAAGKLV